MKKIKAYDKNDKVIFSASAKTDDEIDRLVEYAFQLDQTFRIEVR